MAKKQKTKSFSFQGFDNKHYRTTDQYVAAVDALFNRATLEISLATAQGKYNPDKPFSFDDYPRTKAKVQTIITDLAKKITAVVETGSRKQWLFACQKNDEFVESIIDTSKVSKARLKKMQDRNLDALHTFQGRKVDGMNLSQRVWKYTEQYKAQIELGLDVGLGEGRSAQQLSKDLRQNLQDPNRLFRRVRDKRGNLQLSKNARAFHPGVGVYRSSAKNAARLTRSEINMAYREADWLRWQQLDFVIGFEVHRSNHEPLCKCKLCERLVGRYPKTFKFKGWHPQCMCYATAILMDEADFDAQELSDLKSALKGTAYKKLEIKNAITDVPENFKDWVAENIDNQANWGSTPYFIKDNFKGGLLSKGLSFATKETPKIDPVQQQLDSLQPSISAIHQMASEWGLNTYIVDDAVAKRNPQAAIKAIQEMRNRVDSAMQELRLFVGDSAKAIKDAKRYGIDSTSLADVLVRVQADKRDWIMGKSTFKQMLESLKQAIVNASTPKSMSVSMPKELKPGSDYLKGEDYTFDKTFFDLIDPSKPIKLVLSKANKGAFYSPGEKAVHLFDAGRNANSKWHAKSVVYHEFGHGIDWQRDLRKSKEVAGMRTEQIKRLKKQGIYKVWVSQYDNDKQRFVNIKIPRKMSLVAYIDHRLKELASKVWSMKPETFTKRGISKMDIIEQIGSTRDTIKSLVISYGDGHSTGYFRQPGKSEAEYLAHAFENAFIGNAVFKKYMPDTYNEMVAFIRSLK